MAKTAAKITVDMTGEEFGNYSIVPEDWYQVRVVEIPELKTGKESGKKYMEWVVKVIGGGQHDGSPMVIRTTLEKGDDPKKSKRWLFHSAMVACKIEKVNEKYSFSLEELMGKEFWVRVVVTENSYNGKVYEKNEIKEIAIEPRLKEQKTATSNGNGSSVFNDEQDDSIPF